MSDGTLLELASRGIKDAVFIGGDRTWFGTPYDRRSPSIREARTEVPQTPVQFGHWLDIDLPHAGDVLAGTDIRIQMPTWLPPEIAAINGDDGAIVEVLAADGVTWVRYGWTNGIANFLVKRWGLFADSVLLSEGWGAFNAWTTDMSTTHLHASVLHATTGTHDGSDASIQRAATPPELVFRIPLPGLDDGEGGGTGLPLCALKSTRLYLRLWLLDKSELVESTALGTDASGLPIYELCPAPWNKRPIRVNGVVSDSVTLPDFDIPAPLIYARYTVLYCEPELRDALMTCRHHILYKQQQRDDFTIDDSQWSPGTLWKRRLDIAGCFQALFVSIQSLARRKQNKRWDCSAPGATDWITGAALDVNAQERIHPWEPRKLRELANATQLRRDVNTALCLYYLVFGSVQEQGDTGPMGPAGTCTLTRTQKTVLKLALAAVPTDPATPGLATAFVTVMGLGWNILEVHGGVCRRVFQG